MSFKEYLTSLLQDERGAISSKRIIALVGALCLFIVFLFHIPVSDHMADIVAAIVGVGMGFTTWDKFSIK